MSAPLPIPLRPQAGASFPARHQRPCDARHLVGERDDHDLGRPAFLKASDPCLSAFGTRLGEADGIFGADVEQMSDVPVAPFVHPINGRLRDELLRP